MVRQLVEVRAKNVKMNKTFLPSRDKNKLDLGTSCPKKYRVLVPYFFEYKPRFLFIFVVIWSGFYSRVDFIIFCGHIKRVERTSFRQKNI